MKSLLFFLTMTVSSIAIAKSGATSGSCSGSLPSAGYYYAYTYQYVFVPGAGGAMQEMHNFNFGGFLAGMEKAPLIDHNDTHAFYNNEKFDLAVPFVSGEGLFVKQKGKVVGPGKQNQAWIKLCDY